MLVFCSSVGLVPFRRGEEYMKTCNIKKLGLIAITVLGIGYISGSMAATSDTIKVGLTTSLSGPAAALGIPSKRGIMIAIDHLNANGGVLGKKIDLVAIDDNTEPSTSAKNTRNLILTENVKVVFGPVSSAAAAADIQAAQRYKIPLILAVSNDVSLTGANFSKYAFAIVPNSYMVPHAVAAYVADISKVNNWERFYTISPNYSYGHSVVKSFLNGMERYGATIEVVGQQWPQLGASDFTQYITAILSENPEFLYVGQYGGDLVTFTKQAMQYDLFNKMGVYGYYGLGILTALGESAPAGAITANRVPPFYQLEGSEAEQFIQSYHDRFNEWPNTWSVLGYAAVQTWVQGVETADSFDGTKVSEALSGATIKSIHGEFEIRACDHLAMSPVYVGTLSKELDPKYGVRVMKIKYKAPPEKITMTCDQKASMRESG